MQTQPLRPNMALVLIAFTVLFGIMLAVVHTIQKDNAAYMSVSGQAFLPPAGGEGQAALAGPLAAATRTPGGPLIDPTADPARTLPKLRMEPQQYTVHPGDTLNQIARRFSVSVDLLVSANGISNPNLVEVGTVLTIPVPNPKPTGPAFKSVPDSELVLGPASSTFKIADFIQSQGGYLAQYHEDYFGRDLSGPEIVQIVAQDYSVNPRLLLAILEYQSGWVTQANPRQETGAFPMGLADSSRRSLYRQMAWAANQLNQGFYLWRVNAVPAWLLADGNVVPPATTLNAGTAGIQQFFASVDGYSDWLQAVSEGGVYAAYTRLFGDPFALAVEPLLPPGLSQPTLQLPFEPGDDWAFTGGPHGGWDEGSAWAAIDFAPPGPAQGCVQSDAWVAAMADGLILRTGTGEVLQDLDGDGLEGTGWVLFYMHIESRDRVQPGTYVKAGDRIGHPSCEGGVSSGTHTHIARKYNGEWIPADQGDLPFVLDGWTAHGDGTEYNGYLERDGTRIDAYAGRSAENGIQR